MDTREKVITLRVTKKLFDRLKAPSPTVKRSQFIRDAITEKFKREDRKQLKK